MYATVVNPDTKIQILKAIHNDVTKHFSVYFVVNPDTKIQILKAIHNSKVIKPL